MKDIKEYITESIKINISKQNQQKIIKKNREKFLKMLTATPSNEKELKANFVWIDPEHAEQAMAQFEGKGWTTKTPLKDKDNQDMYDALNSNGGWWFEFTPKGMYNKYYHKCIITIVSQATKPVAIMLRGYNGCWTMSGEDYVSGGYSIDEINLD